MEKVWRGIDPHCRWNGSLEFPIDYEYVLAEMWETKPVALFVRERLEQAYKLADKEEAKKVAKWMKLPAIERLALEHAEQLETDRIMEELLQEPDEDTTDDDDDDDDDDTNKSTCW